jgi:response regulator NasT
MSAFAPTVLTVEDDPIIRADLRLVLEGAGFDVCADARDGVEAVELARRHEPDVILLDLGLPRLDGPDAARQILDERVVPIVALTGYSGGELLERALDAGAAGYVLKPFSEGDVVDKLQSVLAVRRVCETMGYSAGFAGEMEKRMLAWGTWKLTG